MKVGFITTAGNAFTGAPLMKELPQSPQLGDFIEFNDDEGRLLGLDGKCLFLDGLHICVGIEGLQQ